MSNHQTTTGVVTYDVLQIEEKVPVQVCTTTRKNELDITLKKGDAVRKTGEKRRRPIPKTSSKEKQTSKKSETKSEAKPTKT